MKLSSITNKYPDGQWFTYADALKVKLKYGQGLDQRLKIATAEFATQAAAALESDGDTKAEVEAAEKAAGQAIVQVFCEDYFVDFAPVADEALTDDEGSEIENTLANRMALMSDVSELYDFIDERISTYDFWT